MLRLTLKSATTLVISALAGSIIVFALLRLVGGDVANVILGQAATAEAAEALRESLGLYNPWWEQYFSWLGGVFTGDLGTSYAARYDIFEQIIVRLEPTAILAVSSLIVSAPISLVLGTYSAINQNKRRGTAVDVAAQIGLAVPAFWLGLILVLTFAVGLGWLPAGGYVSILDDPIAGLRSLVLPVTALSIGITSVFTRYVRSSMIDILSEDFISTAMAKGRTKRSAALVHGVRNASIPLVTIGTLQLGSLMAGTVVIENVFVIPGLGRLLLVAVLGREVVVVQSLVLVILLMILMLNFVMDIAYGFLDPRIRDKPASAVDA